MTDKFIANVAIDMAATKNPKCSSHQFNDRGCRSRRLKTATNQRDIMYSTKKKEMEKHWYIHWK